MVRINETGGRVDNRNQNQFSRSLNSWKRKQELDRIERENISILKRIGRKITFLNFFYSLFIIKYVFQKKNFYIKIPKTIYDFSKKIITVEKRIKSINFSILIIFDDSYLKNYKRGPSDATI